MIKYIWSDAESVKSATIISCHTDTYVSTSFDTSPSLDNPYTLAYVCILDNVAL